MKRSILVCVCIAVMLIYVCSLLVVKETTRRATVKTQFCVAMEEAANRFEAYQRHKADLDFQMGVASIGVAVQMAPQFDTKERVYQEHTKLNQLYVELFDAQIMNDDEILQKLIEVCNTLQQRPNDIVVYQTIQEVITHLDRS